jgi:hypothetical protein
VWCTNLGFVISTNVSTILFITVYDIVSHCVSLFIIAPAKPHPRPLPRCVVLSELIAIKPPNNRVLRPLLLVFLHCKDVMLQLLIQKTLKFPSACRWKLA